MCGRPASTDECVENVDEALLALVALPKKRAMVCQIPLNKPNHKVGRQRLVVVTGFRACCDYLCYSDEDTLSVELDKGLKCLQEIVRDARKSEFCEAVEDRGELIVETASFSVVERRLVAALTREGSRRKEQLACDSVKNRPGSLGPLPIRFGPRGERLFDVPQFQIAQYVRAAVNMSRNTSMARRRIASRVSSGCSVDP